MPSEAVIEPCLPIIVACAEITTRRRHLNSFNTKTLAVGRMDCKSLACGCRVNAELAFEARISHD